MLEQHGTQSALASRVLRTVCLPRQLDEAFFADVRQRLGALNRIEPEGRFAATRFDLPRQLVRYHTPLLDLAPHAGRDLERFRKLRGEAERLRAVRRVRRHEVTEEDEHVVSTDGWQ